MALAKGDRVRLTRGEGADGTVVSVLEGGDDAYVRLDSGNACTFPVDELTELGAQASESKAWPPGGIETK